MTEQLMYAEINVVNVVIMGIIALRALGSVYGKTERGRIFVASVVFAAIANVFDLAWNLSVTDNWMLPAWARYTINFMHFMTLGSSSLCWLFYIDSIQGNKKISKVHIIYAIPLFVLATLLILTRYNGCLYSIDANGVYHRGKLFYSQQILSYGYVIYASFKSFVYAMYKKNYANRQYFLSMTAFVIPPIICGTLQIFIQNIPLLSCGIMISFLLAYINSTEMLISIDPLTDIPNRREFLRHLTDELKTLKSREKLYLAFLDIDRFKEINDSYGHNEGDRVLKETASALKAYVKNRNAYCARYGGDEFSVICITENEEEGSFSDLVEAIREANIKAGGRTVEVSMGCTEFCGGTDSIPDMISRADNAMYMMKRMGAAKRKESETR